MSRENLGPGVSRQQSPDRGPASPPDDRGRGRRGCGAVMAPTMRPRATRCGQPACSA
jgi:hypothetical protein